MSSHSSEHEGGTYEPMSKSIPYDGREMSGNHSPYQGYGRPREERTHWKKRPYGSSSPRGDQGAHSILLGEAGRAQLGGNSSDSGHSSNGHRRRLTGHKRHHNGTSSLKARGYFHPSSNGRSSSSHSSSLLYHMSSSSSSSSSSRRRIKLSKVAPPMGRFCLPLMILIKRKKVGDNHENCVDLDICVKTRILTRCWMEILLLDLLFWLNHEENNSKLLVNISHEVVLDLLDIATLI
eukprot:TRINITY_DN2681_c0_g1_i1.p1 TRINITY_DN2681_c0_g1~~TRINITY_DN2681_c0_g1_i1.p1  ORF type:complete len:250 (-),score=27.69 TRINITY_DN2681_c0_g1_i1:12-719(-)